MIVLFSVWTDTLLFSRSERKIRIALGSVLNWPISYMRGTRPGQKRESLALMLFAFIFVNCIICSLPPLGRPNVIVSWPWPLIVNDPRRIWWTIKSHSPHLIIDSTPVLDKTEMLNRFNKHFVASCSLINNVSDDQLPAYNSAGNASVTNTFSFKPFTVEEGCKAMRSLNLKKVSGSGQFLSLLLTS